MSPIVVLVALLFAAAGVGAKGAEPGQCSDYSAERNVYWGDLHIHTSYSMDAYIFDTRLNPEDAYRFARGESRMLPPLDENGKGTVPFQISRPLDFAAVTDHVHEWLWPPALSAGANKIPGKSRPA